jgi:hypothetical protein
MVDEITDLLKMSKGVGANANTGFFGVKSI